MDAPTLTVEETGQVFVLDGEVSTVGRGEGIDVALQDRTVSRLHAELVRRGPHLYVSDLGLSANGTRVNGRPVGRRLLADGDVVSFGNTRCRVTGAGVHEVAAAQTELRHADTPALTRRESEVLTSLCRPALSQDAFVAPATAREIADELVVTEAAVKQHLLRLYAKFRIPEGLGRRTRLANEVVSAGVVRPLPDDRVGAISRAV
jgi:DNA-binding CsgD family transcriptional regulator